jgi:signal peptidase
MTSLVASGGPAVHDRTVRRFRAVWDGGRWALVVGIVILWVVAFRPQRLGGPVDFVAVEGISMTPTLHNGDVAGVRKQSSYQRGDIIAYRVPAGETGAGTQVIHRIVGGDGTDGFVTRGDHNHYDDPLWHPKTADVIGKLWFHVPHVLALITWLRSPLGLATIVATFTFGLVAWPPKRGPTNRGEVGSTKTRRSGQPCS